MSNVRRQGYKGKGASRKISKKGAEKGAEFATCADIFESVFRDTVIYPRGKRRKEKHYTVFVFPFPAAAAASFLSHIHSLRFRSLAYAALFFRS